MNQFEFLCPKSHSYGEFKQEILVFNDNLREFATRVQYISSLAAHIKIFFEKVYQEICFFWQQLESSKSQLKIND
ncbi:MAG: hypothetical protein AAGF26_14300 [Cyanobacteria bacterium P01_G01_bin.49]